MITLHHNRTVTDDFAALLGSYPDKELPTITRSTIPLLAYWRSYAQRIPDLLSRLHAEQTDTARLHFELTVPSATIPGTKRLNKASHTDLMIFAGDLAVAIEGKWTEPRYQTVKEWLGSEPTENRLGVIDHWLAMIGRQTGTALARDDFHETVYQMVHRAASACHGQAGKVALLYQCFGTADANHEGYENDLRRLHRQLGHPETFSFFLHRCTLVPTDHFHTVRKSIENGSASPAAAIRNALQTGDLFEFTADEMIPVHETR